jgi:hypothetical protein
VHTADAVPPHRREEIQVDDPKKNVDDELESRLDDLSSTLTDDEIGSESSRSSQLGETDTDSTDLDTDDADQDADADDPS